MLTFEALLNYAKERRMPTSKVRGIVREYLQVLILKELYRSESGRKLFFTGGTYLRLVHNTKRFSEDLDFNAAGLKKGDFETSAKVIVRELKRMNIHCVVKFHHWKNILAADFIFPEVEKEYRIVSEHSRKEGLVIKFETNSPQWKIEPQTEVISGFSELIPCQCTQRGALFADKIDALLTKTRGRHLYDIIFMLAHNYPIDSNILRLFGYKEEPLMLILNRVKEFSARELNDQAQALRPFLFEEADAELIINAHVIIPSMLEKYRAAASQYPGVS
ncbi:MAG: nucleotidyl transferase AbiEii/AbiGii toxin family protein [Candidatus Omnitrophica bacterium]|nr:nucleotidyl transferase AbiEii/AbiGii toxin family protein [Candidatus Omnitrophota bacterium]